MARPEIFTLLDARQERIDAEARMDARNARRDAKARAKFAATKAGRAIAEGRALRWCPPQYPGGAAEYRANNRESF